MSETIYLIYGKPHRLCDCDKLTNKCLLGHERTMHTTGFYQCLIPAHGVVIDNLSSANAGQTVSDELAAARACIRFLRSHITHQEFTHSFEYEVKACPLCKGFNEHAPAITAAQEDKP